MNDLQQFENYLFTQNASPATVKNYLADIRKFFSWHEQTYYHLLSPSAISPSLIEAYKKSLIPTISPQSLERYLASLKKYCNFLVSENLLHITPFSSQSLTGHTKHDPWYIQHFSHYLYNNNFSDLTIKNYISDVEQFISWAEVVLPILSTEGIKTISSDLLTAYKDRSLNFGLLSVGSLNRKLSSLKRYIVWARDQGHITQDIVFSHIPDFTQASNRILDVDKRLDAYLEQFSYPQPEEEETRPYSSFPPLRMIQKTKKGLTTLFDILITIPIVSGLQKGTSLVPSSTIFTSSVEAALPRQNFLDLATLRHVEEELFAPLNPVALAPLPAHKRFGHSLLRSHSNLMTAYHQNPFRYFLHLGTLLLFMGLCGVGTGLFMDNPNQDAAVLGTQSTNTKLFSFQGKLTDRNGAAVTKPTIIRMSMYNDSIATGSSLLWQETQEVTPGLDGTFTTTLGSQTPLPASILAQNKDVFVGIAIGSDIELRPRQLLPTTTLSESAQTLSGLLPITAAGAGNKNVVLTLDAAGDLTIGGTASPVFQATGGTFTLSGNILQLQSSLGSNGDIVLAPDGLGNIDLQRPLRNTTDMGRLEFSKGAVTIDDSLAVMATSSSTPAFFINQDGTGPLIVASGSGSVQFSVDSIGNGTFGANLTVNGTSGIHMGGIGAGISFTSPGDHLISASNAGTLVLGSDLSLADNVNLIPKTQDGTNNLGSTTRPFSTTYTKDLVLSDAGSESNIQVQKGGSFAVATSPNSDTDFKTRFFIGNSGQVGIGTTTPEYKLDIKDSQTSTAVMQIVNESRSSDADGLIIKLGNTSPNTDNRYIEFKDGNGNRVGSISGDSGGIAFNTTSADFAEYFTKSSAAQNIEKATIVCQTKEGVSPCSNQNQTVLGVVSTKPGFTGGTPGPDKVLVALLGQVPTSVVTLSGSIKPGDPITGSPIPGIGVKATKPGMIVGRALTGYSDEKGQVGKITVLVSPQWYDPDVYLTDTGELHLGKIASNYTIYNGTSASIVSRIGAFAHAVIASLEAGAIKAGEITTDSLAVTGSSVTIAGVSLKDYILQTVTDAELFKQQDLVTPTRTISSIRTDIISPLAEDSDISLKFTKDELLVTNRTGSTVASIDKSGNASYAGTLQSESLAVATDATVSGTLRVGRLIADEIVGASSSATYVTNITNVYNATPSSSLIANNPSPTPVPLIVQTPTPDDGFISDYTPIASLSSYMVYAPYLKTDFGAVTNSFAVYGGTSLSDTAISGQLNVGKNLSITNTSIDTLGTPLSLQSHGLANIELMGNLVSIDTSGNLKVAGDASFEKNVTIRGSLLAHLIAPLPEKDIFIQLGNGTEPSEQKLVVANSSGSAVLEVNQKGDLTSSGSGSFIDILAKSLKVVRSASADTSLTETTATSSAGTATILKGQKERTITTPYVKEDSLIYVSPVSDTGGLSPYVARQVIENIEENQKASFTISLPQTTTKEVKVNWWIIN